MTTTVLVTNPNGDLYGASRMMVESAAAFRAAGWRVVVTTPDTGEIMSELTALGAEVRQCPSPVLRKTYQTIGGLTRLTWTVARTVVPGLRLLRSVRPDVVYVNTITQPLWLVLARALRLPVVVHVHEGEATAPRPVRTALATPLLLATSLVVNSRFSTGVLVDAIPRLRRRCTVVYNGVVGPPAIVPPRPHLDPPLRLLYVGRLSDRKGPADAIEAVRILADQGIPARLDVVGSVYPGYESVEAELRAQAARVGADRVRFLGFHPEVWPFLAQSDVLLVPSRVDEPFGNTAVEGALAARPVVASDVGGLPEAVAGLQAAVLVPARDPKAIAAAVADVWSRWGVVRSAAMQDAERAAQRFSPTGYRTRMVETVGLAIRTT